MRSLIARIQRLEGKVGSGHCTCQRNDIGKRFLVFVDDEAASCAAQASHDTCRAVHTEDDKSLCVLVRHFTMHEHSRRGPNTCSPLTLK
jgi:hypothetical protein